MTERKTHINIEVKYKKNYVTDDMAETLMAALNDCGVDVASGIGHPTGIFLEHFFAMCVEVTEKMNEMFDYHLKKNHPPRDLTCGYRVEDPIVLQSDESGHQIFICISTRNPTYVPYKVKMGLQPATDPGMSRAWWENRKRKQHE